VTALVTLRDQLWAALGGVRDPELDEPLTDLGFVSECEADDERRVRVRLRLPTYFCAPNFAYLMVADAYEAVAGVPGVAAVDVALVDHFAADEINAGVAAGVGFARSFPGLTAGDDVAALRRTFLRKAVLAGQDRVCRPLLAQGWRPEELVATRLGDIPPSPDLDRLVARRRELGIPSDAGAPLLVDADGRSLTLDRLPLHLRLARATRVSIDGNAGLCRGLLATRYGDAG